MTVHVGFVSDVPPSPQHNTNTTQALVVVGLALLRAAPAGPITFPIGPGCFCDPSWLRVGTAGWLGVTQRFCARVASLTALGPGAAARGAVDAEVLAGIAVFLADRATLSGRCDSPRMAAPSYVWYPTRMTRPSHDSSIACMLGTPTVCLTHRPDHPTARAMMPPPALLPLHLASPLPGRCRCYRLDTGWPSSSGSTRGRCADHPTGV